jgi:hypothetical protein
MSDIEFTMKVYGFHVEKGELIAASDAQAAVDVMQSEYSKLAQENERLKECLQQLCSNSSFSVNFPLECESIEVLLESKDD